jgi:hypothetical protein
MPLRPGENAADFAAEIADRLRGKRQYFPRETLDSRGTFNPLVEGSIPSHPTNNINDLKCSMLLNPSLFEGPASKSACFVDHEPEGTVAPIAHRSVDDSADETAVFEGVRLR